MLRSQIRCALKANVQKVSVGRRLLAGFVAVLCLLPYAESANARVDDASKADVFVIQADGTDTLCREATPDEKLQFKKINPKNLRQINHLEAQKETQLAAQQASVPHLTIILRATDHLEANPPAKAAFLRAAAAWEAVITSPVTIFINADFGPDNFGVAWTSGTLGSTSAPSQSSVPFSTVRANLIAGANSVAKTTTYNALPTGSIPTDVGNATTVSVSNSIARAIGLLPTTATDTDSSAKMGFNSTFNFDFDSSDGITSGQFDFEAIVTHEIGHALGFTSRAGNGGTTPAMWDLYRFRTGTTNATFTTATRVMTIGGATGSELQFYFVPDSTELGLSTGGPSGVSTGGGDGNQSSHWKQASLNGGVFAGYIGIMDPRIPTSTHREITSNDTNALNILGYNSNVLAQPAAPANDNFSAAPVVAGCSGTANGTNLSASRETGEPNHSPDNGGGSRSVWYQWQSPSTGNVTFNTLGSDFDTVMGVYTGNSVDSLASVGKDDDASTDHTSAVTFAATAGTIYHIAVDGYDNDSGGDTGAIVLNWSATNCNVTPTNPIDTAGFFVRQNYIDFLNREPDTAGFTFWTDQITACGADAACTEVKRINVSGAFFLSIEFQETGYLVYRVYKTAFGNLPGAPVPVVLSDFLRDTQQIGQGVQVNVGNWQAQLEANKQAYALAFVQRPDFLAAYPNTMTATQFVTQLNTNAGGVLSAAQQTAQITALGGTPSDVTRRSQVLRAVADDDDLRTAEFNKAFVLMQYFGYLRRNPNDAPNSNFDGFNFWLGKLNQFGNFVNAEMVKAFLVSSEYRQRFGP